MQPSLFDRVFSYPASQNVLPAENLATEITAYFLEHWPRFRQRFLQGIGIEHPGSHWIVETQHRLYAPGRGWHQKIPDLLLRSGDGTVLVLVEVKIDAGVTYSGEIAQSQLYQDYVDSECAKKHIQQGQLVLLTRWLPGNLFIDRAKSVRFTDLARWLAECIAAESDTNVPIVFLAKQWVAFLQAKRWAMLEINDSHVHAIKAMGELLPQLWDVLAAAGQEVLANSDRWIRVPGAKSSSAAWPTGNSIWDAKIALVGNVKAAVQAGFFYGEQDGETALCPVVWFDDRLELRDCPELQDLVRPGYWTGHYVHFPSLVSIIAAKTSSQLVWDTAKSQITSVFPHLQPTTGFAGQLPDTSSLSLPSP